MNTLTSGLSTAWQTFADLLDPPENPYVHDPVGWVSDRLGEFLWSKQREILEAVVQHRYVAVKSAHDTGKSHSASRAVAWWLDTREDPFATTTAPTTKQVHAILWRYIGQAHRKGNLPGRITLDDEWYMGPGGKELVAFGRKPADHDQSAFQGIHALSPLILVDEACGVPKSIFDAVDALATNSNARVLAIGNPDDPASHFAQICKPGSGWHVITVSAFDTPAYTGEKVPEELLPLLVSPEWVEERKLRWGVNSPIYQSKVLGEFPDISDDSLILPRWIEAAQKRTIKRNRRPLMSWDIARFGDDESVGMRREGGWVRLHRAHHKADTMATTGQIAKAHREISDERGLNDWPTIVVDVVGVGAGVYDRLIELGLPATPYNGGEAPVDKERFVNARAEDYWHLRELFEADEIDIDQLDDVLAAQLGSIKWTVDSRGRIKIESKDDMRKRGLPSPDRADTVAMAFSRRAQGGPAINAESHRGESITGDLMTKAW
jgi:hypothetical protein